jgi:beta-N-acetylhexosaminidase
MSLGPLMIDLRGTAVSSEEKRWLMQPAVGGVILFSRNFQNIGQLEELVRSIRALRVPELLIAVDQEGGRVQRFREPFTPLPPMRALGYFFDEQPGQALGLVRQLGWLMAAELLAVGIDLSFTPVVDLDRGLAEVIGDRAFHSEAEAVARLASEFVTGIREAGMAAVAKHFPTHAGALADSHLEHAVDTRAYGDVLDDLVPYRRLIEAGLQAVMAAHVRFPEMDDQPASYSRWWLKGQLRTELGFSGAVFSDDLAMLGADVARSFAERALLALDAGCDMVLLCNKPDKIPELIEALNATLNPPSQLHLIRLRGRKGPRWSELRESTRWRAARAALDEFHARPELKLEG